MSHVITSLDLKFERKINEEIGVIREENEAVRDSLNLDKKRDELSLKKSNITTKFPCADERKRWK